MALALRRLLAVLLPWAIAVPALAQASWPERPVHVVITWAAGGTTDFVARLYAQQLGAALGQSFVVENRTGGSGAIGWNQVVQARPDGYTLLVTDNSIVTVPPLLPDLGFDMRAAMDPVAELEKNIRP